jgi:hypothetical protein
MEPRGWRQADRAAAFAGKAHSSAVPSAAEGMEKMPAAQKRVSHADSKRGNAAISPQCLPVR